MKEYLVRFDWIFFIRKLSYFFYQHSSQYPHSLLYNYVDYCKTMLRTDYNYLFLKICFERKAKIYNKQLRKKGEQ